MSQHTFYVVKGGALGIRQGRATLFTTMWCCLWGRGQRGNNGIYSLSVTSLTSHKQIVPFQVLIPKWVVLCTFNHPMGLSNKLSCETRIFSQFFTARGFESLVLWSVLLPSCSSWLICAQMWDYPVHQPLPHPCSLPPCCSSSLPTSHLCPSYWAG